MVSWLHSRADEFHGPLLSNLSTVVKTMDGPTTTTVNPDRLFRAICKQAPMFQGYRQHDSQELLRHLLDGVISEELAQLKLKSDPPPNADASVRSPCAYPTSFFALTHNLRLATHVGMPCYLRLAMPCDVP